MEIEGKKIDITPELLILSRNILRQYTQQIDARDCHKCVMYKTCPNDFVECPAKWKDVDYETD
nr:MAG TPA: hypothetical protein [Caudoviricetes sp.]DAP83567.1 MAG TPA: hypothetical protein [Caudoviricetes sp.]